MTGVGIVGCGLVGQKRAEALRGARLVACADIDLTHAQTLAGRYANCRAFGDAASLFSDPEVDAVIVATPHHLLAPTAAAAISNGKHVLIEKPGGRSAAELENLLRLVRERGLVAHVG